MSSLSSSSLLSSITTSTVPSENVEYDIEHKNKQYLCLYYTITAGLLGDNMGSDEQEIIEMIYLIIDIEQKKTVDVYRQYVRPININLLSDEYKQISGIDEKLVFSSEVDLEEAITKFDLFLRKSYLHPDREVNLIFVCDTCLHLRQCLHPESVKKSIQSLPDYYWSYFDLRSEFGHIYKGDECNKLNSMLENINHDSFCFHVELNICPLSEDDYCMRNIRHMELIVHKMLNDGYKFEKSNVIMRNLLPGICSLDESILENTVIRARGLPWQCTDQDVAKFFRGLNIEKGGVALCLSSQGRRNGEALIRFSTVEHRELALQRHKHHIGSRYIEVYKATGRDFLNIAGGSSAEAHAFLQRDGQVIIRMRGLPFDATSKDVIEFFTRGTQPGNIIDNEQGVLFVHYPDGRSTGDAFVMFKTEAEASQALLKHKEIMGTRYIELFRSTAAEVQQVFRRSQDVKYSQASLKEIPFTPLPMLPPEMLTGGNKKDCIRVRNLPLECAVEQILEFLGVHSQHIVAHGVHMIYNSHGQPSGEAFIQMDSEAASFNVAVHKNNKYMFFNGKKRYIEVIQCSGEDMNHILLGLVPSNLISTNIQSQTAMYTSRRNTSVLPISGLSSQMLSSTMPVSLTNPSQSSGISNIPLSSMQSSTSSSALVTVPTVNGFHPNTAYYPMQIFYYPTPNVSQSIYLQTGQMPATPMALVLRGDASQY